MTKKTHSYQNESIRVSFDGNICAHAGYCFGELHDVFDGDNNPPINLAGGKIDDIIRVVEMCPSSALTYQRLDGSANEVAEASTSATIVPDGPLALRGNLKLGDQQYSRLTLCRCGKSAEKPFCDGSHKQTSFDDSLYVEAESSDGDGGDDGETENAAVSFKAILNGPIFINGSVSFKKIDGTELCKREKAAICRCGASKTKPFCDGSHKTIGFEAP